MPQPHPQRMHVHYTVVINQMLESLRKGVFERCTSTGSEAFSLYYALLMLPSLKCQVCFILIETICQKFLAKLLHCSKTCLLKLPIHLFTYFVIQHIRIHQQYTRNLKNIKDNRHYSNLNKCLNSELLATL